MASRSNIAAALFVIFVIVVPVTFLAAECAAAPAVAIGMAMIVVNYELLFASRSAFPKYGFMLLCAGSLGLWCLAKPAGEFIMKNGVVALPLWIAIVALSAVGPFYLRRLAAHPKFCKGDAP